MWLIPWDEGQNDRVEEKIARKGFMLNKARADQRTDYLVQYIYKIKEAAAKRINNLTLFELNPLSF